MGQLWVSSLLSHHGKGTQVLLPRAELPLSVRREDSHEGASPWRGHSGSSSSVTYYVTLAALVAETGHFFASLLSQNSWGPSPRVQPMTRAAEVSEVCLCWGLSPQSHVMLRPSLFYTI